MQKVPLGSLWPCYALPPAYSQHDVLTSALQKTPCGATGKKEKQRKPWTLGKYFHSSSIQLGPYKEAGGIASLRGATLSGKAGSEPGPCMVGYLT